MEQKRYFYSAKVVSVYDGDTIRVNMDLGFSITYNKILIRLARINTPELRGHEREDGLKARDFLRNLILDEEVILNTIQDKKGKYGRYLAEIWLKQGSSYININDLLLTKGFANLYQVS